jgi:protein involved in polysaccharide export with SLBB domain
MTNNVSKRLRQWVIAGALVIVSVGLQGCATSEPANVFAELPGEGGPLQTNGAQVSGAQAGGSGQEKGAHTNGGRANGDSSEVIRVGESLTISFTDIPQALPAFEERVKDDGTITLHQNMTFIAAGKTRGELEKEIRARYVPSYYVNLTVVIKLQERLYFVGGEVRSPNRYAYMSRTTLLKAIQSAGDFTEYADKKRVRLTRSEGRTEIINCIKALEDHRHDPEILPGDKIHVPRRRFW